METYSIKDFKEAGVPLDIREYEQSLVRGYDYGKQSVISSVDLQDELNNVHLSKRTASYRLGYETGLRYYFNKEDTQCNNEIESSVILYMLTKHALKIAHLSREDIYSTLNSLIIQTE